MGLVESMADNMAKEIGNKTREFFEFVLPPVDMALYSDRLEVTADMPGFEKKDIKISVEGGILWIQACKQAMEEKDAEIICCQRPNIIDKKLRLPAEISDGSDYAGSAKYENGMLVIRLPIQKSSQDIKIE